MNTRVTTENNIRRSRGKRSLIAMAVAAVAALALAACAAAPAPAPTAPSAAMATEPPTVQPQPESKPEPTLAVAAPTVEAAIPTPTAAAATTVLVAQSDALGAHLVAADGKTLYLFLKDRQGKSMCDDSCTQSWPPLSVAGTPVAGEGVDAAKLSVVQRSDGTSQVAYNGWPLYFFAQDTQPGEAKGQGVIGQWFVVSPEGERVETAAAAAPTAPAAPETKSFVIVPDQTTAQYSIDEIFINQGNKLATAVGRTSQVEGSLVLNFADPAASELGKFTVDISTLKSDSSRRDGAIRDRWLESARFPMATFVAKEIRSFPANAKEGEALSFQIAGDMTVKETTREQVWDVTATLNGDTLTGKATTFLMLADYNIPVPEILGILKVTDGLTATLDFSMTAQ